MALNCLNSTFKFIVYQGKCPVFIDPKSDLKLAARRVLWGKALNAGQACVAPDYVLIPGEVQDQFIKELKEV